MASLGSLRHTGFFFTQFGFGAAKSGDDHSSSPRQYRFRGIMLSWIGDASEVLSISVSGSHNGPTNSHTEIGTYEDAASLSHHSGAGESKGRGKF